ncbi:phospholipase D-like domain-containing protein [Sporolactobacillus vineae]|uniref:phospholipase D-like domain-containing protein n=1 Tax=Sporolactobacillus vineae TaxID=444463 RepID=UPI00028A0DAD|nr:phospholipase D-like domain-containing protein [Sporolactobacillus vineae]
MHLILIIVLLILLLLLLVIIGILLDIVTGIKVRHPHLPLYKPATGMNRLRYFTDGRSLFADMAAAMAQARDHIHLSFFIFEVDHVGREWLNLLEKKAGEGVDVRLLVDTLASRSVKKYEDELTRAGVHLAFSGSVSFPFTFYLLNRRNHRKIAVIDGKTGYFGGFNVSRDYIGNKPETGSWHDNHLKVEGESVAELQRLFLADWAAAGQNAQDRGHFYPQLAKGPSDLTLMGSSGRQVEGLFAEKLSAAHQSITIGSPYFIPSRKLMNVLTDRLEHGVRLTILLPMKKDHPLVRPASYLYLRPLVEKGAQLYHFYQGFYHSKVFVIDQSLCYIGTANFDRRSFFWNDELIGFSSDHQLIQSVTGQLETEIRNSSVLVGAETIAGRSPFEKLKSVCSDWFRSFL